MNDVGRPAHRNRDLSGPGAEVDQAAVADREQAGEDLEQLRRIRRPLNFSAYFGPRKIGFGVMKRSRMRGI
jgi:hypothetical protein